MASDTEIKRFNQDIAKRLAENEAETDMDFEEEEGGGEKQGEEIMDDFTDPKSITPPSSLQELIERLHRIFAHDDINIDYVKTLMESYKSNPKEWKKFAKFDPHRYTRNLVDEGNGKFNLMVLCWNEAQGSSIHSHAGSHCFLKVLSGQVKEELYEWPEHLIAAHEATGRTDIEQDDDQFGQMKMREEHCYGADRCTYICDDIGLHRVENPSHTDKGVTLHLYSPPFDECLCFDERTGKPVTSKVTFWSKFGKRTPFGKDPKLASACEKENN